MRSKSYFASRIFKMTAKKNPVKHWAFLHRNRLIRPEQDRVRQGTSASVPGS